MNLSSVLALLFTALSATFLVAAKENDLNERRLDPKESSSSGGDGSKGSKSSKSRSRDECPLKTKSSNTKECRQMSSKGRKKPDLAVCTGVRGNGDRLFAHFPALARVVEAFGPIGGVAGGSSASVTAFLLESIESNPFVTECGDRCCNSEEQIARISFLLKTVERLPESSNVSIQDLLGPVIQEIQEANILDDLQSDNQLKQEVAVAKLLEILQDQPPKVQALINPDVVTLLQSSPDPVFHANDILTASSDDFNIGDDVLVFIRPYLLNYEGAGELVDIVASFYAGLKPIDLDAMEALLLDCAATSSIGLEWSAIDSMAASGGSTCGEAFADLYNDFVNARDITSPRRLDNDVGNRLRTMITTSVIEGDAVGIWENAIVDYEAVMPVTFDPDFSDFRIGYFGDKKSLKRAMKRLPRLFDDEKTERFISLKTVAWKQVLLRSPAEPTLSRGVPINNKQVSLGGWTDPTPAQVLTSMGCDKIVLINRPNGIGQFSVDIPTLLGASQEELDHLYKLSDPSSSFATALATADATICADWDAPDSDDVEALAKTGYEGPLLSSDDCILSLGVGASNDQVVGCTPGAV